MPIAKKIPRGSVCNGSVKRQKENTGMSNSMCQATFVAFMSVQLLCLIKFVFRHRAEALKAPVARRRKKLEDSYKWHQFNFDADNEMQWIKEHTPAATSTDYGKNLIDAQNLHKKHKVIFF